MKCLKCGQETSKSYKVDFDGVEKEIAYCQKCLMDVLKESIPFKNIPSPSEDSRRRNRHLSYEGEMTIFVEAPLKILEEMFGKSGQIKRKKTLKMKEKSLSSKEN